MGMNGGAKKVTAYRCTSCTDLHDKRADAVYCCNDRAQEKAAEDRKAAAKVKYTRMVKRLRVRITRKDAIGGGDFFTGEAKCPGGNGRSWQRVFKVRSYKRAAIAPIIKAQLSRHLQSGCVCSG